MSDRDTLKTEGDESRLQSAYERGFVGAYYTHEGAQSFADTLARLYCTRYGEDALRTYGLAGSGAGKLSLPFLAVTQHFPNCFPGFAQERGDCVAHSTRNAVWISYMNELVYGNNSSRHGIPTLSSEAERSGCISSSAIYWYRNHGGDGWQCAEAAEVCLTKSSMWLCKDYPELGFDLTKYSGKTAGKWGSSPPPESVTEYGKQHLCRNSTVCREYESVRDMLANGNAISSCGSEAFDNQRNKYGVASRSMGRKWYHAMVYGGVDDRPETVEREGCGLVAVGNSWGPNWISGETRIHGTDQHLPQGWFWARWTDLHNRYAIAMGASIGWPARKLPNWGLEGIV
jgi:hypothetical protein